MELVHEFDYHAGLKPPVEIGGPLGTHMFFEVTGEGRVKGERINAAVMTGGGDWLLVGADGRGRLDVRAQFQTDDGAIVYVQYQGVIEINAVVQEVLAGQRPGTEYSDEYFRTTPRFETGDPRYSWLNENVFVAEGHLLEGPGVEYRVYRVT